MLGQRNKLVAVVDAIAMFIIWSKKFILLSNIYKVHGFFNTWGIPFKNRDDNDTIVSMLYIWEERVRSNLLFSESGPFPKCLHEIFKQFSG